MTAMAWFTRERVIRFSDCDPAGIVFFPRYFTMFNGLVEDWVDDALGIGYQPLVIGRRIGLPTVHMEVDFVAISDMGDRVALRLAVEKIGTKSLTLSLRCDGADGNRVSLRQVLVTTSLETHRAVELPPDLRAAVERFKASA